MEISIMYSCLVYKVCIFGWAGGMLGLFLCDLFLHFLGEEC